MTQSHQNEIDQLVSESGYLTEAWRKAETTTESEKRADIAENGQRAFFAIAKMRTETEQLLFEAKSVVHDLNQNDRIGQIEFDESLLAECLRLTKGDTLKAKFLASAAKED